MTPPECPTCDGTGLLHGLCADCAGTGQDLHPQTSDRTAMPHPAPILRAPDTHTSTPDGAAAHAYRLGQDDPHPWGCRCHPCVMDEAGPFGENA